jgi:hypothetical protein
MFTFTPGFGGVDPIRIAQQMTVVAPFYSGLAYSVGALAGKHHLLDGVFRRSSMQIEPEPTETNQSEKPATELN